MAVEPLQVITVVAKMRQAAQDLRNVYELIHTGTQVIDNIDVLTAAVIWLGTAYDQVDHIMTDLLSFETIEVINKTTGELVGEEDFINVTTGTDATTSSPMQVSYLVRFTTNYRGSQGRKFVPGCTEGQLDSNGLLTSTALSALALYGTAVQNGFLANANAFVPGCDNEEKLRFAAFDTVIVNDRVGTMGRRKPGVGS